MPEIDMTDAPTAAVEAPVEVVDAPVAEPTPVEPVAEVPVAPKPRTLDAVASDLIAAAADLEGFVSDEIGMVNSYIERNWESLKAAAMADVEATKAKKTALVTDLLNELHVAHNWLTSTINAIL